MSDMSSTDIDNDEKIVITTSSLDNFSYDYSNIDISITSNLNTGSPYGSYYNSGIGGIGAISGAASYPTINIRDIMPDPSFRVDGDLIVRGRNICEVIDKIEKRLSILVPDPKKLEKYEALKKAYEQYKLIESLIDDDIEEEK